MEKKYKEIDKFILVVQSVDFIPQNYKGVLSPYHPLG